MQYQDSVTNNDFPSPGKHVTTTISSEIKKNMNVLNDILKEIQKIDQKTVSPDKKKF